MPHFLSLATWRRFAYAPVWMMFFLGFSAGLPLLLLFSSLSVWLREADIARSTVTFFSWAALGYSFKFVWAPLIDRLPLPFFSAWLGQRRAWLLLSQVAVSLAIIGMALLNPQENLLWLAAAAVLLGFSSATQDIVIDAFRIEIAEEEWQALLSAMYTTGYRLGMIAAGAGVLKLAEFFGSTQGNYFYQAWQWSYLSMAALMGIGMLTTLLAYEPPRSQARLYTLHGAGTSLRFLLLFLLTVLTFVSMFFVNEPLAHLLKTTLENHGWAKPLAAVLVEFLRLSQALQVALTVALVSVRLRVVQENILADTYLSPVRDFFVRYGRQALLILALIALYRISDIVAGIVGNIFYQDLQFTKGQIADVSKVLGLVMAIVGSLLGGVLTLRYGIMRILFLGAFLAAASNFLFSLLNHLTVINGYYFPDVTLLAFCISADNLSAGIATAAFIAYLSALTNIRFTAMQYAILSSMMLLLPKILGGYSGSMVDSIGYSNFFVLSALLGVPVLLLIYLARHSLQQNTRKENHTQAKT
jgi:PAT family beta-lactamase induction signal transducer AmpG